MFVGKYNGRANLKIGYCIGISVFGVYVPKNTFKRHANSLFFLYNIKFTNMKYKKS